MRNRSVLLLDSDSVAAFLIPHGINFRVCELRRGLGILILKVAEDFVFTDHPLRVKDCSVVGADSITACWISNSTISDGWFGVSTMNKLVLAALLVP